VRGGNEPLATAACTVVFAATVHAAVRLVNGTNLQNLLFSELCWWGFIISGWDAESLRASTCLERRRYLFPLVLTRENKDDSYLRNVWDISTNNRASHHRRPESSQ